MHYQSECCPSCHSHPSELMSVHTEEFVCGICSQTSNRIRPYATED